MNTIPKRLFSSAKSGLYKEFLKDVAKIEAPERIEALATILDLQNYELVNPRERAGLNPFLVPIAKDKTDNSVIGYLRWPTQRDAMPLQIVKTNETGLSLLSLNTDQFCTRQAVEMDFAGNNKAPLALQAANPEKKYSLGDARNYFTTAKLPLVSPEQKERLGLDRFVLIKVGHFPDCYRRIAADYMKVGNTLNCLVTCERAISLFFGWGSPVSFHVGLLNKLGRRAEATDASKSALSLPIWTMAESKEELNEVISSAGYSSIQVLADMHAFRSTDPRKSEVDEGLTQEQVLLDQAAHLMDAVALGKLGGWDSIRKDLAQRYHDGGYPDIAKFIETVN